MSLVYDTRKDMDAWSIATGGERPAACLSLSTVAQSVSTQAAALELV